VSGPHRWKQSWPGNFCLDCGIDDPVEECVATNSECKCVPGPDGKPLGECLVKVSSCPARDNLSDSSER